MTIFIFIFSTTKDETMPEILDEETIEILSSMDSFFIQQRVRWIEAITQGCWEQPNVYDVFDHETNKRIMVR